VIGVAQDTTNAAVGLALHLVIAEEGGDEIFAETREAVLSRLSDLGYDDIDVPESPSAFSERYITLVGEVASRLADERAHLGGDTVALPFFILHTHALYAASNLVFKGEIDAQSRGILDACIADLWLDREEVLDSLEREVRWIATPREDDVATFKRELFRATFAWLERVIDMTSDEKEDATRAAAHQLTEEIADFRAEVREQGRRLAELIRAGNAEAKGALEEVQSRLVENGLAPEKAAELTVDDPARFWERLARWGRSEVARDAAEGVLWVVLDFVPGGTGVKLGVRVARAVREALKQSTEQAQKA
jgi:hypothetical protein